MNNERIAWLIVFIASIILFFATALSRLDFAVKTFSVLVVLVVNSVSLAKAFNTENYYVFLNIKRTEKGLRKIKQLALKHEGAIKKLVDLGLAVSFGPFYSYYVFGNSRKFYTYTALLIVFIAFLEFNNPSAIVLASGLIGGLALIGLSLMGVNAYSILFAHSTQAGATLAIPFVTIPGEALIAIILIIVSHEAFHALVFSIEKIKIKNSGIALLSFIPIAAFVEPDEKKLEKTTITNKRRALIAGSAANFYLFVIFTLITIPFMLFYNNQSKGVIVEGVVSNSTASGFLKAGDVITSFNNTPIYNVQSLANLTSITKKGEVIPMTVNGVNVTAVFIQNSLLGIAGANLIANFYFIPGWFINSVTIALQWIVILSISIAVINILPLYITDGARLMYEEIKEKKGRKTAARMTSLASLIVLIVIIINIIPAL
ncbi:MAG: M50 family metallopeptidase [Candidatus Marsarchaeota archaeon]|nr:M50 family metallopeptidase [Candidatus Marsarchaeota archaeon]